jgi:cysteine desulfurase/selenocysteine lyase
VTTDTNILALPDFDVQAIRSQFPILNLTVNGAPLVYLDNAATTQKPLMVIDAISDYYKSLNSNVHRGVHYLSQKATDAYEVARRKVQALINARHEHEIIITKGTTDSINLVADTFGREFLQAGDEILISGMEHHSNIVPWQMICERKEAKLKVIPVKDNGELDMEAFDQLLTDNVKMVAVTYVSNALGTVNPIREIIAKAHALDIPVLIDAAQGVQHLRIDVQELDCEFIVFSSHKMYGPTGVGVLYGKEAWLNKLPPYQGGGDMIKTVTFEKTVYNELPFKFEAGTPNIEAGICLGNAIDFMNEVGLDNIAAYEHQLLAYATAQVQELDGIRLIGTAAEKASVLSFLVDGAHPYDVGVLLDKQGVAVRTGHHCAQPLMDRFGIPGTVRASFAVYNTTEDIDRFVTALKRAIQMLR